MSYDPLASILARAGVSGLGREEKAPYMTPEEEESVLSALGGVGLSALQVVGGALDTPGSIIRGGVSLASGGEFGDIRGLKDRVYGRDLLRQWGMAGSQDNWANWTGGLALDLALDPLTYVTGGTFGAAKKGMGWIARHIGTLQPLSAVQRTSTNLMGSINRMVDSTADVATRVARKEVLIGEAHAAARGLGLGTGKHAADAFLKEGAEGVLSGTVGLGLPFMKPMVTFNVPGMAKGLDKLAGYAKYGKLPFSGGFSPGGTASQLFDTTVVDRRTEILQQVLREQTPGMQMERAGAYAKAYGDLDILAHPALKDLVGDVSGGTLRSLVEMTGKGLPENLVDRLAIFEKEGMGRLYSAHGITNQKTIDVVDPLLERWRAAATDALREQAAEGIDVSKINDPTIFFGASREQSVKSAADIAELEASRAIPMRGVERLKRKEWTKGYGPTDTQHGGTSSVNNLVKDKVLKAAVHGKDANKPIAHILGNYLMPNQAFADDVILKLDAIKDAMVNDSSIQITDKFLHKYGMDKGMYEAFTAKREKAELVVDIIKQLPEGFSKDAGIDFFSNAIIDDVLRGQLNAKSRAFGAGVVHTAAARAATKDATEDTVSISKALFDNDLKGAQRWVAFAWRMANDELDNGFTQANYNILKEGDDPAVAMIGQGIADMQAFMAGKGPVNHFNTGPLSGFGGTKLKDVLKAGEAMGKGRKDLLRAIAEKSDAIPDTWVKQLNSTNKVSSKAAQKKILNLQVDTTLGQDIASSLSRHRSELAAIQEWHVPADLVADMTGKVSRWQHPDSIKPIIKVHDVVTNIFKANVTSPFISFLTRNLTSLIWQDAVAGGAENPLGMIRAWKVARKFVQGETVPGAAKHPRFYNRKWDKTLGTADEQATKELRQLFAANEGSPRHIGEAADTIGDIRGADPGDLAAAAARQSGLPSEIRKNLHHGPENQAQGIFSKVPGSTEDSVIGQMFKPFYKDELGNRLGRFRDYGYVQNVRGGVGRAASGEVSGNIPVATGQAANSFAEDMGRAATFLRKSEEGASAFIAAMESKLAHVEFSKMTAFERNFMKRIVPWYSFQRHMIPEQLMAIARRPGSSLPSLAIRASGSPRDFVPEQAEGAIPWGVEADGRQKYVKLDLPHEILNDLFTLKPSTMGTLQSTGKNMLSQLHPLFKAPLELVTDQSFFRRSARGLNEMFSHLGEISGGHVDDTLLNHALMSSPVSRYVSTAVGLKNPFKTPLEKGINLTTGLRISSVNMNAARDRAYTRAATDIMSGLGGRMLENIYLPKDHNLDEEQMISFETMKSLLRSIHGNAKDRATVQAERLSVHNASI